MECPNGGSTFYSKKVPSFYSQGLKLAYINGGFTVRSLRFQPAIFINITPSGLGRKANLTWAESSMVTLTGTIHARRCLQ